MTLHSRLAVHGPVDALALFDFARGLLGVPLEKQIQVKPSPCHFDPGTVHVGNQIGQGFSAIVDMEYCVERPIRYPDDDEGSKWYPPKDTFIELGWDTAYGYKDEFGGCSRLHARYIQQVGEYLDECRVDWSWYDEFYGDWHSRYDMLDMLGYKRA